MSEGPLPLTVSTAWSCFLSGRPRATPQLHGKRGRDRARPLGEHPSSGKKAHYVSWWADRKSTRLNFSHVAISYAVFCLKKKKNKRKQQHNKSKKIRNTPQPHRTT